MQFSHVCMCCSSPSCESGRKRLQVFWLCWWCIIAWTMQCQLSLWCLCMAVLCNVPCVRVLAGCGCVGGPKEHHTSSVVQRFLLVNQPYV